MKTKLLIAAMAMALAFIGTASAQLERVTPCLPANSKIYIAPMPGDFHTFLAKALKEVEAPLFIVTDRNQADFEMKERAVEEDEPKSLESGAFANHGGSEESASVEIANIKTNRIVYSATATFSGASDRDSARRGKKAVAKGMAGMLRNKMKEDAKAGCKL